MDKETSVALYYRDARGRKAQLSLAEDVDLAQKGVGSQVENRLVTSQRGPNHFEDHRQPEDRDRYPSMSAFTHTTAHGLAQNPSWHFSQTIGEDRHPRMLSSFEVDEQG